MLLELIRQKRLKVFDVLDGVFVTDEDGVRSLDDDEVVDAAERDEASVGDGDISARRVLDDWPAEAVIVRIQSQVGRQRGPGPDIIPVELREHGGDASGMFHDRIVHRDFRERGEMFRDMRGQAVE